MPFQEYATFFTPEQLNTMTAALSAAVETLSRRSGLPLSQRTKTELAELILLHASKHALDVDELAKAALEAWVLVPPRRSVEAAACGQ